MQRKIELYDRDEGTYRETEQGKAAWDAGDLFFAGTTKEETKEDMGELPEKMQCQKVANATAAFAFAQGNAFCYLGLAGFPPPPRSIIVGT